MPQSGTRTGKSAKKYTRGNETDRLNRVSPDVYADKLRASAKIDEITQASTDYVNEAPDHERVDDIVGFGRGNVLMRIGNNDYKAEVVIGNRKDGGAIFYDVVKVEPTSFAEKETKQSPLLGNANAGTNRLETAPTSTIAPESESVNIPNRSLSTGQSWDENDYQADILIGNRADGSLVFHDVTNVTPTSFTEAQEKQPAEPRNDFVANDRQGAASGNNVPSVTESVKFQNRTLSTGQSWDELVKKYGAKEQGRAPRASNVQMPNQTDDNNRAISRIFNALNSNQGK